MEVVFLKVCLGGTFNTLHKGHEALLARAFGLGDFVLIGLVSDGFAGTFKGRPIQPYEERERALRQHIETNHHSNFDIRPLDDAVGPAGNGDYDAIVVSRDTLPGAENINRVRAANGLKELDVVVIDMVLADDGSPISATRVEAGETGADGRMTT